MKPAPSRVLLATVFCGALCFLILRLLPESKPAAEERASAPKTAQRESKVDLAADPIPALESKQVAVATPPTEILQVQPPSGSAETTLAAADACIQGQLENPGTNSADYPPIWNCLAALDWKAVGPDDLASWVCAKARPFWLNGLVAANAWHARPANEALGYLAGFNPACANVRESLIQIMMVEVIEARDPAWVVALERSFTPEICFTPGNSDQCILLAEYFMRRGSFHVTKLMEEGGRGLLGGDEAQVTRAGAVCLYVKSTMKTDPSAGFDQGAASNAWEYAESMVHSPKTPPASASAIAQFLVSQQTWPSGNSKPALHTLLGALNDPRFEMRIAGSIVGMESGASGPKGADPQLWSEVWGKSVEIAQKYQIGLPGMAASGQPK